MTRRQIAWYVLCPALAIGALFGAWQWYEHEFLSPDIKTMLVDAMDPYMTLDSVESVLGDAQQRARTRKDAEVIDLFLKAEELQAEVNRTKLGTLDGAMGTLPPAPAQGFEEVPSLAGEQQGPMAKEVRPQAGAEPSAAGNKNEMEQKAAQAKKLFAELRAELGMPAN
ncbi:MAG TPA: hypothetical protein VMU19_07710 [Bryobacteraceae bacterium]|nr:hypothetical protein [Bryobacteraceae bacterium]